MSRTREEFVTMMHMLKDVVHIVPREDYAAFMKAGTEVSPDPNDALYFALALKLNCAIWSNDARLKKQDTVKIHNTTEVMKLV